MEAKLLGHGGVKRVSQATGVGRGSILAGIKELGFPQRVLLDQPRRVRRAGAGRKKLVDRDPGVRVALERLVEPATRGDPQSPLRWTCKSLMQLARELGEQGHAISHVSVGVLLKELGYSLQGNRNTLEGASHPDRNAQFEYVHDKTQAALRAGQPVISVDTKKKELVGRYKNGGHLQPYPIRLCTRHLIRAFLEAQNHFSYQGVSRAFHCSTSASGVLLRTSACAIHPPTQQRNPSFRAGF